MFNPSKYYTGLLFVLVITIVWVAGKPKDLRSDLWRFKMFAECRGNFDAYLDKEMHLGISAIKSHVAPNDTLYRLETDQTLHYENYKFYVYPVRLLDVPIEVAKRRSPLLVELTDNVNIQADFLNSYPHWVQIDPAHIIYSKTEFSIFEAPKTSLLKSVLLFTAIQLCLFLLGYLTLIRAKVNPLLKTLLAPLLGYVMLNMVSVVLMVVTGRLMPFLSAGLLLVIGVFLFLFNRSLVKKEIVSLKDVLEDFLDFIRKPGLGVVSSWMLILTLAAFGISLLHILFRPIWAGDAVAFWLMKASIIYNDGLDFSWGVQNEYPIFWSQLFAVFYGLNGPINQLLSKWYVIVELLLMYGFIWEFTSGLSRRIRIFFLFVFFPVFGYHWFYSLFAETIVVLFSFAFARITALHLEGRFSLKNYLVFGSILMIGVAHSKLEGVFQILMILLPFLVVYGRVKSAAFVHFSGLALLLVVSLMAWKGFVVGNGWHVSEHAVELPTFNKVLLIVEKLLFVLGNMSFFSGAILGVFIQFFITKEPSKISQALLVGIILMWLFSGLALIGWETQRIEDLAWTAMPRLIWHATPLVVMLSIQLLKDSLQSQTLVVEAP
ncbi:MAG: hypothetical protein ACPGD8_06310 [Flavobacteriales bacterium]